MMEKQGLTAEQVEERRRQGKVNAKVSSSTMSVGKIIKTNVFTYFNLIFAILALLLAGVRAWRDMFFMFVIFFNTAIGIVQEIHAKKVLDRLELLDVPGVRVIRDGSRQEISAEELVQDDVVILGAGNQIPADARVIFGEAFVNEALLTGEADEITKRSGDQLMSGSFIVSGEVTAVLEKVGKEAYINQLTLQATKSRKGEQSEMIRSLNRLIQMVGIVIIPIGMLLFYQSYFVSSETLRGSISKMVAAVIGMIPEGLYLLASVAMAVSTARLAGRRVLVHDMKCIETLARVDVLCVDKTGTITEPGMKVYGVEELEPGVGKEEISLLLGDFAANMSRDNATMEAMSDYFVNNTGKKAERVISFSAKAKYSAVVFDGKSYVLGAPERVLRERCGQWRGQVEASAGRGFRVLMLARYDGVPDGKELTGEAEPLGLVLLVNPIRQGARETFSYFADNDVSIKVISGDNPLTVSVIAGEAGIRGAENYIDAAELKEEADYAEAVKKYTVFGRVQPDQKCRLVRAYKESGRTVAMTGDGVNDVLALRDADCSVAMASGADAASNVAQLVLMDSDFSRMPDVVAEGRRVVNNIQRTASLYLVKNIFSMLMALFSVIFVMEYPMTPPQVSLVAMFTIGIPSFFLALEPNKNRISGHFLSNVFCRALPAGITDFAGVMVMYVAAAGAGIGKDSISAAAVVIMAGVGFFMLIRTAWPIRGWHLVLVAAMFAGWLGAILLMPGFFDIHGMTPENRWIAAIVLVAALPLMILLEKAVNALMKSLKTRKSS